MEYSEYRRFDAVGLAELVAKREVSAGELLDVAINRAEQVNPKINAIVRPMYDIARKRVTEELDGPFAGVPFLLKDLMQNYAGVPTGSGSGAMRDHAATEHAEVVNRWLDAGLVVFGKTATPELGTKPVTEPEISRPTRNPWNLNHTPGGSSGGTAAAVAAGILPVAGASDGGGSIRIPAACCGLVGLKPGRGLVPAGPDAAELLHGAATEGVISRTVRDTAAMLDVLTVRPDLGGPYLPARPETPYAELARRDPGTLRIGYTTKSPLGSAVHPEAVAAVDNAVALLAKLGHDVTPAEPDVDGAALAQDFLAMWAVEASVTIAEMCRATGASPKDFELDNRLLAASARDTRASQYAAGLRRWNAHSRALAKFHETYDLLLTPSLARPPVRIGELDTPKPVRYLGEILLRLGVVPYFAKTKLWTDTILANLEPVPFTQLANVTGRPAMSLPLHRTKDGLPLGVQFVGGLGSEPMLLALATQLEAEQKWADEEPDLE